MIIILQYWFYCWRTSPNHMLLSGIISLFPFHIMKSAQPPPPPNKAARPAFVMYCSVKYRETWNHIQTVNSNVRVFVIGGEILCRQQCGTFFSFLLVNNYCITVNLAHCRHLMLTRRVSSGLLYCRSNSLAAAKHNIIRAKNRKGSSWLPALHVFLK